MLPNHPKQLAPRKKEPGNPFKAPTPTSPPKNSKFQSNLLRQTQSSNMQISSNKSKLQHSPPTIQSSNIQSPPTNGKLQHPISSNKFKAPTFKSLPIIQSSDIQISCLQLIQSSNMQISSNKSKPQHSPPTIQSSNTQSPPTNRKLQHSNRSQQYQSANTHASSDKFKLQHSISSNKLKAPTFNNSSSQLIQSPANSIPNIQILQQFKAQTFILLRKNSRLQHPKSRRAPRSYR